MGIKEPSVAKRKSIVLEAIERYYPKKSGLSVIREGPYCSLYRIEGEGRVIKIAAEHRIDLESLFYQCLDEHGVPAIENDRLHDCVLLLEDLTVSKSWRLANENDTAKKTIGEGCAEWCQAFHAAGRLVLKRDPALSKTLRWEYDSINAENLNRAGKALLLENLPVWRSACEAADQLVAYVRPRVDTLTYNDFHHVNLAVSRQDESIITLFDFDNSGKGFAESDLRNMANGLRGKALQSFSENLPLDPALFAVDEILSALYGLIVASRRDMIPAWAGVLIESMKTAEFSEGLKRVKLLL